MDRAAGRPGMRLPASQVTASLELAREFHEVTSGLALVGANTVQAHLAQLARSTRSSENPAHAGGTLPVVLCRVRRRRRSRRGIRGGIKAVWAHKGGCPAANYPLTSGDPGGVRIG